MPVSNKIIVANTQNCKIVGDDLKTNAVDDLWSLSSFVVTALNYRTPGGQEDARKMPVDACKAHFQSHLTLV